MLGGTARAGIELGVRKGDLARRSGLLGAGVLNPGVPTLEPFCEEGISTRRYKA